jgi:pilus assembly protein Flp/PilA
MQFFSRLFADERGATAIEYGLIAALLSIALMAGARGLGTQISSTFSKTSSTLSTSNAA